jgi:6,7-dimethyl-8-ribityllumazine synthase
MHEPTRVLIVEARFYSDVAESLVEGSAQVLDAAGVSYDRLEVPGVFEVPAAIHNVAVSLSSSSETTKYLGYIALGCVIRGETDHYNHICRETSRAIMDLSLSGGLAIGFGIITCENINQAWARASAKKQNVGGGAAHACLRMSTIQQKYPMAQP